MSILICDSLHNGFRYAVASVFEANKTPETHYPIIGLYERLFSAVQSLYFELALTTMQFIQLHDVGLDT